MFIRAYYDKLTGNGLKWYSLEGGAYRIPTFEEDYQAIKELSERITKSYVLKKWLDWPNSSTDRKIPLLTNIYCLIALLKKIKFS